MPAIRPSRPALFLVLALSVGCATGSGGGPAPGPGGFDAGMPAPGTDAGPAEPSDGGVGEAGLDAGSPGTDAGPVPCTSADECSDGLACNGAERCELGRCVPGTAPTCDDGIACTANRCVEPGTCAYAPDDSLCAAGQTCGATGCTGGGSSCAESPCRLVGPQCGCGAGQACYHSGATRACAAAGSGGDGASCSASSDCAAGLTCVNHSSVAGTNLGMCTRYCASDSDCSGPGSLCLELDSAASPGVRVCTRSCDPIYGTGCRPGTTCNVYQESGGAMRFLTDCTGPVGTRDTYFPCSTDRDCAENHACVGGECLRWCDYFTDEGCDFLDICLRPNPRILVDGVEYGFCG